MSETAIVMMRMNMERLRLDVLRAVPDKQGTALAVEIEGLGHRVIACMVARLGDAEPMGVQGGIGLPMCDSL